MATPSQPVRTNGGRMTYLIALLAVCLIIAAIATALRLMLGGMNHYNPNAVHYCPICEEREEDCDCAAC